MNGFADEIASKYDLKDDKYGSPINEGRVMSAEFDKFWIVTVYVPNAKEDLSRLELRYKHWDPAFLEHIKTLEKTKPVLVCGDFNVAHTELDLANPKANVKNHGFTVEERGGFDAYENAGFVDIFRRLNPEGNHYTWWSHWANARTRNVGWRIDYWLVSQSIVDKVSDVKINTDILGSDHCPISLQLTI
jgi:exodeoxyribonuclease-3